jgi:redox-sensitive bicupin YhaK (pirin superfamily)
MPIQISSPLNGIPRGGPQFSVISFDLDALVKRGSPLIAFDDFRASGRPFPPHPHAGFSAVTYVFEDSAGGLRVADSLGNDICIGAGGIAWTQAGEGILHQEVPNPPGRELHGVQFFVNLSSHNKLTAPQTFCLESADIPQWHSEQGDRVRVVVGEYRKTVSPLLPLEPFTVLDADIRTVLEVEMSSTQHGLVYVQSGRVQISAPSHAAGLNTGQAVAANGAGHLRISAAPRARILFLCGDAIQENVLAKGPFIMNTQAQLEDAFRRYQQGQMGCLASLPKE